MRPPHLATAAGRAAGGLVILGLSALGAGCGSGLSDQSMTTSSLPPRPQMGLVREPPPPYEQIGSLGRTDQPPPPYYRWNRTPGGLTTGALPAYAYPPPRSWQSPQPARPALPPAAGYAGGRIIEVQEGDTLYALSRRHGVSVAELIDANRLDRAEIQVGQRLELPPRARW